MKLSEKTTWDQKNLSSTQISKTADVGMGFGWYEDPDQNDQNIFLILRSSFNKNVIFTFRTMRSIQ